jgi:hypothetical protein
MCDSFAGKVYIWHRDNDPEESGNTLCINPEKINSVTEIIEAVREYDSCFNY